MNKAAPAGLRWNSNRQQRGVTLVELMVSLLITFVLVGAAGYLYLSSRQSQRAIDESASVNDTGAFVMETLGRELMSAGFFPTRWNEAGNFAVAKYDYVKSIDNAAAYRSGIFGCEGQHFNPTSGVCEDNSNGGKQDSLVLSYFTLDPKDVGQREDCTGADVAKDTKVHNKPLRVWGPAGAPTDEHQAPYAPLMVINAYSLTPSTMQVDKRNVSTSSLSCYGNGAASYQPLVSGVEDLQITYGEAAAAAGSLSPQQFVTATQVSNWQKVVAVRVCVLVHSPTNGIKLAQTSAGDRSYVDCNGQKVAQAGNDSTLFKRFIQTFGVRNHQTATY